MKNRVKMSTIHLIRLPEGEERRTWIKIVFEERMTTNFSELIKDINLQIQE